MDGKIVGRIVFSVVTVLFVMFFVANLKKIKYFVSFRASLEALPAAVNVSISKDGRTFFEKSFFPNRDNVYVVHDFDTTPYLDGKAGGVTVTINKEVFTSFKLYRYSNYIGLEPGKYRIIFFSEKQQFMRLPAPRGRRQDVQK
jgi:hypothetical protein